MTVTTTSPAPRGARRDGCPDCQAASRRGGVSRRHFLGGALAVTGAAAALSTVGTRLAFAATPDYAGDTLVVLNLRGGFDGLSAVVPAGDPDYYAARPSIAVPKASVLPLDTMWGLHPQLAPLLPLWKAGTMAAVVAVGQPDPTRSHFEATEEMERAAPNSSLRTGWLDRALGLRSLGTVFQACELGSASPSMQFAGPAPVLSLGSVDGFGLAAANDTDPTVAATESARWETALRRLHDGAAMPLAAPAQTALQALATTRQLKAAGYTPAAGATYDQTSELHRSLRDVARLVKAGVGLQVAALDYGNWDMHDGLGAATAGWMHDQLAELAKGLSAFAADLGSGMSKVCVVTITEFGRRVAENASHGVDHGHGQTMLLLGGGVIGGTVHGRWPGLSPAALDDGDVAGTSDYRNVLAELLRKRCGQGGLDQVFPGLTSWTELGVARLG